MLWQQQCTQRELCLFYLVHYNPSTMLAHSQIARVLLTAESPMVAISPTTAVPSINGINSCSKVHPIWKNAAENNWASYQGIACVRLAFKVLHRLESYGQQSEEILERTTILNQWESRQRRGGREKWMRREGGGERIKGEEYFFSWNKAVWIKTMVGKKGTISLPLVVSARSSISARCLTPTDILNSKHMGPLAT